MYGPIWGVKQAGGFERGGGAEVLHVCVCAPEDIQVT